MKILFVLRHSGYVRNLESTLRMLCDRGHRVDLAFQIAGTHWLLDPADVTQQLSDEYPRFSRSVIPVRHDAYGFAAREMRLGLDYLRYLEPEYVNAPKLRERAKRGVREQLLRATDSGLFSTSLGRKVVAAGLHARLRTVPCDAHIDTFLEVHRPDVLAIAPLIEPGAPQAEYVRSARAQGIPIALCVSSWDNLTNKGLIHGPVDLVTVWNEMMKKEAITLHGVPAERVAVTGAATFDHWFAWQPSTTRPEFCAQVGLPADRPFILYLCSSRFIAPQEVPFIRSWIDQLRSAASPALRQAGVLIRPHPQNATQWRDVDLSGSGAVVFPAAGATPSDLKGRQDYFDSIYHSAAVVGINTTAQIESAIIGRGVYTLLAPEFQETQEGTLHFEHLRSVNGGLLREAQTFGDHLAQLDAVLANPAIDAEQCRRFVEAFIRPYGMQSPSTPRMVDALEALGRRGPTPPRAAPWWSPLLRVGVAQRGDQLLREELRKEQLKADRDRRKKTKAAIEAQAGAGVNQAGENVPQ